MPSEGIQDVNAGSASTGTGSSSTTGTSPHQPSGSQGTGQPAAAAASAAGGQQGTGQPAQGSGTAAAVVTGQPGTGRAAEDRSNWIPPHRMRQASRENEQLKREIAQMRSQLGALTGITPPAAGPQRRLPQGVTEEHIAQAREDLELVYPGIGKLLDSGRLDKLVQFLDSGLDGVEQQTQHYYRSLGAQTIRSLEAGIKEIVPNISKRGIGRVLSAFQASLAGDEEFFDRWQSGDPTLVEEFLNEYRTDVLDPYGTGRTASATGAIVRGRALPRGGNSSTVIPGQSQEPQLDPNDPDAIHKRAFGRVQQLRRAGSAA